jgi:hypothetical protein
MKNLCLILILISSVSLAQSRRIWDTRVSLNRLANFATDLQKDKPAALSEDGFEELFIEALNASPERAQLIQSVLQGVEQISRESYEEARKEQALSYESRHRNTTRSFSSFRNLVTIVADPRLRNWVIQQSSSENIFALALTQIHTLDETEFQFFADNFIKSLIKTNEELKLLNQTLKSDYINERIEQARFILKKDGVSNERMNEIVPKLKAEASAHYEKSIAANISFAAELLSNVFSGRIANANIQNPEAARILPLQFHRIAHLMHRALKETSAYSDSMVMEIRKVAQMYIDMTFEHASPSMKTALELSYKTPTSLVDLNNILKLPVTCKSLVTK